MNEQLKEAVSEAIREALGGALDCGRVWSAWGVGTMSEDDFSPVADDAERVEEIADAVLDALAATGKQQVGEVQGDTHTDEMDEIHQIAFEIGGDDEGGYQFTAEDLEQFVRALAARQPGAQEAVAVVGSDFTLLWAGSGPIAPMVERHGLKRGSLLYAAPPAQGTDLGQLRSQVLGLTRRVEPISGQRFSYVQLDDVLALIDQRDAAPPAQGIDPSGGMAQEYQRWIDFYHAGEGSYGDFLSKHVLIDDQRDAAPGVDRGE